MQLNKTLTVQKEEESSSLTGSTNQELLFVRRKDIDPLTRLQLGILGMGPSYRNCTIKDLCIAYEVSHEFIYGLTRTLKKNGAALFGFKTLSELTSLAKVLTSIRFAIQGKLETQGSHHGLGNLGKDWGGDYNSTNFISQSLEVVGTLLPNTLKSKEPKHLTYLCDEVYSGGRAILVTIEAQSMAVLDIKLLDKALTAEAWEERFNLLSANNILASELIKDQGKAMLSATHVLPESTLIMADTFHGVAKRLGNYYQQLHRRLEKAMKEEDKLKEQVQNAASDKMWFKQQLQLEAKQAKVKDLLECLDWFEPTYWSIINQLRPFTSLGQVRDKTKAKQAIEFGLELLALLPLKDIQKHINYLTKLLDNGELLRFMDKVPALSEKWQEKLDQDTHWLWMLYWLWWKKSFQTHSSTVQKRAQQEAQAAKELLQAYYIDKQPKEPHQFDQIRLQVFASLDTIVQASSLVETFNSILKPFIKSARGQLSQALLNLVMFFHNHRVFDNRCKRGGKAPIELLTGQALEKSYIDLIMDKVQLAFTKNGVASLKQLHALLCPKNEPKKTRNKKPNEQIKQQQLASIVTLVPSGIPEILEATG